MSETQGIQVFRLWVGPDTEPGGLGVSQGWPIEWFLDPDRQPVSETARHIVAQLRKRGQL